MLLRLFLSTVVLIFSVSNLLGQVYISTDMLNYRNIRVRMTLQDKNTAVPIPWASVYLIPEGDTTITQFALSDEQGRVLLKEVPVGRYQVNAEIIGYKAYQAVHKLERNEEDLGIISLEQDIQQLEAAFVSAIGNPITIKQDTIEFNAAAYRVGENAMLEDLIKKMPGMEVSEDGSVQLNGESIDKITVGGRTFFFNNPTAALKNLPAKIVEKIKVIDRENKSAEFTGISSGNDKEKIMDVQLKEEYTEGWFGNANLGAGYSLTQENPDQLITNPGLLYNGNAMITAYSEKDQLVFIGNSLNVTDPSGISFYAYSPIEDDYSKLRGLSTDASAGLNYNTQRLKNFETTVSADYKYSSKDDRSRSSRTSFLSQADPLLNNSYKEGFGEQQRVSGSVEMERTEKKKWSLYVSEQFRFWDNHAENQNESSTYQGDSLLNSATTSSWSKNKRFDNTLYINGGVKINHQHRSLSLSVLHDYITSDSEKQEYSQLQEMGSTQVQELFYKTAQTYHYLDTDLSYTEPLSQRWRLQVSARTQMNLEETNTRATNPDGSFNDYYSAYANSHYLSEEGRLLLQYRNDTTRIRLGASFEMVLNELDSRSLGVESHSGYNDWLFNWSPFLSYNYTAGGHMVHIHYSGTSSQVSNEKSAPTLDLSNRVQIQAGNIYLRPTYHHTMNLEYRHNNRQTFSFINLFLNGRSTQRSIVYASWFDENGIRYAVPVNSSTPSYGADLHANYSRPLDVAKKLTLQLGGNVSYNNNLSYQATQFLPGIAIDEFDYNAFMDKFWGKDHTGEVFYSGQSGFQESKMRTLGWSAHLSLRYNLDKLSLGTEVRTDNSRSRYSLDPTANMNTWKHNFKGDILYQPGLGWEFKTDASYRMYRGYANGYGEPELQWNASIGKTIGKWTLSVNVYDILNQTRNLQRSTSAEYTEDTYRNVMGRYFLINLSFNFGKMNASKNNAVQNAMYRSIR